MRLKSPQLNSAKRLLKEAFNLIADVQAMFHNSGDARTASRLRTIGEAVLTHLIRPKARSYWDSHRSNAQRFQRRSHLADWFEQVRCERVGG